MVKKILSTLLILVVFSFVSLADTIEFSGKKIIVSQQSHLWVDTTKSLDLAGVKSEMKEHGLKGKLDLDYVKYPVWMAIDIQNKSSNDRIMAVFENPLLDSIALFEDTNSTIPVSYNYFGEGFLNRTYKGTFQKFVLEIPVGSTRTFYFRINSTEQMILPLSISTESEALQNNNLRDLIYGAFMGVILVMLFYNLFVYYSTKDTNYLYYVLYILFIGLGQITLSGHMFSLVIPDLPSVYKYAIVVLPALSGIFAVFFIQHFLQGSILEPKLNKVLSVVAVSYGLAGIVRLLGFDQISARMMDSIGLPGSIVVFIMAFRVYKKGFKSASYFIAAWSVFIIGVVFFVFRNLSLLPFNAVTTYTLPLGASLEVALLSFALADKINTLQIQKREKEKEALLAALENERLIKGQNIMLEQKVQERTLDLAKSNEQLNDTLTNLKATQSQLVEQEKMASLGQLTAGIAHEINNPINFVTSNINPLKRDISMIQDLMNNLESLCLSEDNSEEKSQKIKNWKKDIDYEYLQEELVFLLKGIDEGAHRTAEIVKGLRVFARNDEDTLLNTDVIEGIESTLVILNNQLGKIEIKKNYEGPQLIDCYPGKLNQVFLNLFSNSIHAVNSKFEANVGGQITITVNVDENYIYLTFEDNGIGMSDEVQKKIFEPFFTTKPVGQGTGLGMSIVFTTIEAHRGKINLSSVLGEGTKFEIQLNRSLIF
ncbi:MAG: histidine kinase [Bacteroidia bacterium]|nr:histidine kinase [Bacteroidia bacterium]MCF8427515.1 histidine kinase [Bacteroidia bacterium]MCF8446737.1 histidine kinase [Bacteroidia bacterium]